MIRRQLEKVKVPDAINCGTSKGFTQVPNEFLRNPKISSKTKAILCILLSNQDGWLSHSSTLSSMMKEGREAIQTGLSELKSLGYLKHFRYRNNTTKKIEGVFWAYTDSPNKFDLKEHILFLERNHLEIVSEENHERENQGLENQTTGNPDYGFSAPNNTKEEKNTKEDKNTFSFFEKTSINSSLFETFWRKYPKKASKGDAKTEWDKLCKQPINKRPDWKTIRDAIRAQMNSERWKEGIIPNASTWLHNQRWMNDPKEMKVFKEPTQTRINRIGAYNPNLVYKTPRKI
jgi:hypothetical protein